MKSLVLIDGNSLLNRVFYATQVFSTKDGRPTNAIFGFTKLLFKIMEDDKPDYLIVTFDMRAPTFRHKMYEGYKATRSPMLPELAAQVQPLKSLLSAMKVAICQKEGVEADDLLGTLSKKFDVHSYIYTGDRDSYQLVDEKTDIFYTKRGVTDLLKLNNENFLEVLGYHPSQVIDLKSLMGDKSDNIPGVEGVGEVTAKKLIAQYDTLDGVYSHINEIKSASLRNKLEAGKDKAYLSYKLATIDRYCDVDIALEDCKTPTEFSDEVREIFNELEFKSLIPLLGGSANQVENIAVKYPEIVEIDNNEDCNNLFSRTGKFFVDFNDCGMSVFRDGKQYNVICGGNDLFSFFSLDQAYNCLGKAFENKDNTVVVYDFKWVLHELKSFGFKYNCAIDDISVMAYVSDYFTSATDFNALCNEKGYDKDYRAFALSCLYNEYLATIKNDGLEALYYDIEKPLINVLFDMEDSGVSVDLVQLEQIKENYLKIINDLKTRIYLGCGCEFNINSPSQLGDTLFNKLGLKSGKKNKSGKYSTNVEVLESLAEDNDVVKLILQYRTYQKLYSTYIEGIKPLIERSSCLVHTTYKQTVTATGRLSSVNPNLQNIPIRKQEGRELRKLFVPRHGNVLIDADYSQIELRLLAHFSGCKELIAAYKNGEDVHAVTASQVFGVPLEEVTPDMRRRAKAVNFGIIYGISEFGLAKDVGVDYKTASDYITAYFNRYTAVKEYMDKNVEYAKQHGYVSTLTGRKRYIKEINSTNYNLRQFGERAAMNMPLQGSSADIIKIAMVNIYNRLKSGGLKTKLILQVHDELVLDAPIEEEDIAKQILKYEMENAVKLVVPLTVDIHSGKNWYEAK